MRVLAIDTALAACSAAVFDTQGGEFLAAESAGMVRGHAEALLPMVSRVMQQAGTRFEDLQRVAVTTGPGSFTGLRVGISAARAIALASGRPAVGVTTLAAYAGPYAEPASRTVVAIDARHQHVYLQVFAAGQPIGQPRIASLAEAVAASAGATRVIGSGGATRVIGSGAPLVEAAWPEAEPAPVFDPQAAPDIGWVARLGAVAAEDSSPPRPLYLRAPDAKPQHAAWVARQ